MPFSCTKGKGVCLNFVKQEDKFSHMHRQKIHIKCSRKDRVRADVVGIISSIILSEFADVEKNILIVVGGPGGTGKTTFSNELAEVLQQASVLRLDDYKLPRHERESLNVFGAHPQANDMALLLEHFALLSSGNSIEKPVYDSASGRAEVTETFTPCKYVIVDGEISTYKDFADYIDFSIFIDSDWQTQLNTRISRDISEKNYDKEKVVATFLHSNIWEFEEYGASSKNSADIHIYCESDYRLTLESMSEALYGKYNKLLGGDYSRVGFRGFVIAVTTPFTSDGRVDKGAFVDHLQYLHEHGVNRICLCGHTGEFYLLTHNERLELLVAASRYFPGYITYNVTSFSLFESVEHIKVAEDMGADGVFALPPLAPVGIADSVLERYFRQLYEAAESNNLTMMIYSNQLCGINAINKTVLRTLPEVYIKDSSRDSDFMQVSDKYFCGEDRRIGTSLQQGAIGFISGAANANPALYCEMENAMYSGEDKRIIEMQGRINNLLYHVGDGSIITQKKIKMHISKYLPGYPIGSRLPYE